MAAKKVCLSGSAHLDIFMLPNIRFNAVWLKGGWIWVYFISVMNNEKDISSLTHQLCDLKCLDTLCVKMPTIRTSVVVSPVRHVHLTHFLHTIWFLSFHDRDV